MKDLKAISSILSEMAKLAQVVEENPFIARSYEGAAQTLEELAAKGETFDSISDFSELPRIGKTIAQKIEEIGEKGTCRAYEKLKEKAPKDIHLFFQIPGLGPKKIRILHEKLGINTLEDLEQSLEMGEIRSLPGFGEKSCQKIRQAIPFVLENKNKVLLFEGWQIGLEILSKLESSPFVKRASFTGPLRRGSAVLSTLDFLVATRAPQKLLLWCKKNLFLSHLHWNKEESFFEDQKSLPLPCRIHFSKEKEFGLYLLLKTGSEEHLQKLRDLASLKGFSFQKDGWKKGRKSLCLEEEEYYSLLDLPFIPPELREDGQEIEFMQSSQRDQLVSREDLQAFFHNHTSWSDGKDSLETMVQAAWEKGAHQISINDHSKAAFYANGLDEKRLMEQIQEIKKIQSSFPQIQILTGSEVDILKDGTLDFGPEVLEKLDMVVASVHSHFQLSAQEMTERILKALSSPHVRILGHPTGRLLLHRPGYSVDLDRILQECLEKGIAIELNCNPMRMEIDWQYLRKYPSLQVAVNADAHHTSHLDYLDLGILQARKGLVTRERLLNHKNAVLLKNQNKK